MSEIPEKDYFLFLLHCSGLGDPIPHQMWLSYSVFQSLACNQFNRPLHIKPALSSKLGFFSLPSFTVSLLFHALLFISHSTLCDEGVKMGVTVILILSFLFSVKLKCTKFYLPQIWSRNYLFQARRVSRSDTKCLV